MKVVAPAPVAPKAKENGGEDRKKRKRKRSNKPREVGAVEVAEVEVPNAD